MKRLLGADRTWKHSPLAHALSLAWSGRGYALLTCSGAGLGDRALLVLTTLWSYRHTHLAARIADPALRPPQSSVQRAAVIGVAASTHGIVFPMLGMLAEVVAPFSSFPHALQAGVPAASAGQPSSLPAIDIIVHITFGEPVVLAFSPWQLYRSSVASADFFDAAGDE